MPNNLTSIRGRRLGIGNRQQLISNEIEITRPCVDASITVSAKVSNVRTITIQLKDADGKDINYVENVQLILYLNADMTAFVVTGGSTGLAIGADGALLSLVAKKVFVATSEADGDIDLTYTDTGSEAAFLGLILPNGRVIVSSALA